MIKARVTVTLKAGVLDPQGQAIGAALGGIGIDTVKTVRQGKLFDIVLDTPDEGVAREQLTLMCERLLANSVVENYQFDIL